MRLTVRAVIAGGCCNHFRDGPRGVANWCVAKDGPCPIFATFRRCKWFETAVLPAWPDVAAEYAALAGQNLSGEMTVTRRAICRHCGEAFKALHNRQQYCSEACRHQGRKDYEQNVAKHTAKRSTNRMTAATPARTRTHRSMILVSSLTQMTFPRHGRWGDGGKGRRSR